MNLMKEPVVHFLILGALLFGAHSALAPRESSEGMERPAIRVTSADAERMAQLWSRQWLRAPTADELVGLLTDDLKEEVLAREARQLRLDQDDTVIRRRLAQKMAFLLEDAADLDNPSDAELLALHEQRRDISGTPARISFIHVFFKGRDAADRARFDMASVDAAFDGRERGDPFLLGEQFADEDEKSLASRFGVPFARAVKSAEPGHWSGPFESSYGLHLVKVTGYTPPGIRPFGEVRDRLAQEWRVGRKEIARARLYDGLLKRYEITADPEIRPLLESVLTAARSTR